MKHYSSEQWSDFVRNVLRDEDKAVMQAHLESGCKRCSAEVDAWIRVRDAAARERSYQPPDGAVRAAKGLVAVYAKPRRTMLAELLFDSFRTPALAGVRSAAPGQRQMLYGIGEYRIDIRVEQKAEGDVVSLVGQILISEEPARAAGQVFVSLVRDRKVLATTQTNEFGEFALQCNMSSGLKLHLAPPDGPHLDIPLFETSSKGASAAAKPIESKNVTEKQPRKSRSTRRKN